MQLDVSAFVDREESTSSLVRFEDASDANTPRLNYSVPLPGAFQGKFYIETDFFNEHIPWTDAAFVDRRVSVKILDLVAQAAGGRNPPLPPLESIAVVARPEPRTAPAGGGGGRSLAAAATAPRESEPRLGAEPVLTRTAAGPAIVFGDSQVSLEVLGAEAANGRAPVLYRTFGGNVKLDFVQEASGNEDANPRFFIIEHYRLSSLFGDYGAGKTVGVFSLLPGEETTLYIRNWRRSEQTVKEASSIFDSFTSEAADEFEQDLQSEITESESQSRNRRVHSQYSGSGEINIGLAKTQHSGSLEHDTTTTSARESAAKNTAKVSNKHSSKASAKRETEVTQELEHKEEQEFERITERKIVNTNLSRTLNIVSRELNQEFTTYFALIDVSLAFVNDLNVVEIFPIHQLDAMLEKYIAPPTGGFVDPSTPFGGQSARSFVRARLIRQINEVYDFRGTRHSLLEEVAIADHGEEVFPVGGAPAGRDTYLRVRRSRDGSGQNPFYEAGDVPVEGVVMNRDAYTVRTPAIIIDSLLGHGVALDNYALGQQQEALRAKQLENRKIEVALDLIAASDPADALEAYRQLFGSVDAELLREVALNPSQH